MASKTKNWTTVAESQFPWEREALEFVRSRFPDRDAYRAWTNFEFIADDGSINEVDLLVFTPEGFFLIEIKSRPGRVRGDAGTWTWETDGKFATVDNPLISANSKAKKLRSLLGRHKAFKNKGRIPFIEALVFCSAPDLRFDLTGNARYRICLTDREATPEKPARKGIMAAIMRRECEGLDPRARGTHDRPMAKVIGRAMTDNGIRPTQRMRKVSDYHLEGIIDEGPGYQDWAASHTQIPGSRRRVRLYLVRAEATPEDRSTIQRAARREYELLEMLQHPGILRVHHNTEHELGPALLFEHDPLSMRLDHYLTQNKDKLTVDQQLDLIRQIAEVLQYAHEKKVIHRGLCPQSILVTELNRDTPRIKIFNWQAGFRHGGTNNGMSRIVTGTSHVDRLVEDSATAYMAPEALTDINSGEHLDVFSLGAIAYHIFSGTVPATNAVDLSEKLRETNGLQISSVLNGASEWLQELVRSSTNPVVPDRIDAVEDFLGILDEVERELIEPEYDAVDDPSRAKIGDLLPGGFRVVRRLGQGSCSVALLVEKDGDDFILKIANESSNNERIEQEGEILRKDEMRHSALVEYVDAVEIGQFRGFLLRPVYSEKEKRTIETLGQRLRSEGKLHVDLLQRFGEDLLTVVNHLEEQGIPHKDIKPDNISVGFVGRGSKLHLVLFDFSLSRTPAENIRAGTNGYLDPLLPLRKLKRWDLHAERYAAAMTLYELATGTLAKWGDGTTDPSHLAPDVEISIEPELIDAALRDSLGDFFTQAFRRDVAERFDNAEEMLRAWRDCFVGLDDSTLLGDDTSHADIRELLSDVTYEMSVGELGISTRAANALDRADILTVKDLLTVPLPVLRLLRGVGNKTRREISATVRVLLELLGKPELEKPFVPKVSDVGTVNLDEGSLSVDLIVNDLLNTGKRKGETFQRTVQLLLGLDSAVKDSWPSQAVIADAADVTRGRIGQIVGELHERWGKNAALTALRADLAEMLVGRGGVMSLRELADVVLVARGSTQDEPLRSAWARAVLRAATEVERRMVEPRFLVKRDEQNILIAADSGLASYARRLGAEADTISAEDPLLPPARTIERLREIEAPHNANLPDARLLRLAAEFSVQSAVSSRQELYPRGMAAARALKLSQGALLGQRTLTVAQIKDRVSGRYPEAQTLPERTALDDVLRSTGFEVVWDEKGESGSGCYVTPMRDLVSVTSGSFSVDRYATRVGAAAGDVSPEQANARQFEEKLQLATRDGAFLAMMVNPKYYERARAELCERFDLELVDLEGVFLDALRSTAGSANVDWDLVLQTDVQPNQGDWDKLMMLVRRAMPAVEECLLKASRTLLVIYPGLLARYGQMDLLNRLSEKVGRKDGIPGLWLLLPGDNAAMIDGKPVPLIGPGQRAPIPESWLQNLHRSANTPTPTETN